MAIIKSEEAREVEALQKVERQLERRERRERIHHIVIGSLAVLLAVAIATGHCTKCRKKFL